jgi:hypothetical protein
MAMPYLACSAFCLATYTACLQAWLDGLKPRRTKPQLRLIIGGKAA